MLKRLQRKFIILTTAISLAVMFTIALAINAVNYNSILNDSDALLEFLIENDMKFQSALVVRDRFSNEIAFTTRFFVVGTDNNFNISFVDTESISSVSPEYAVIYAQEADELGRTFGTVGDFRFLKTDNEFGETFVFLDIEEELNGFYTFMYLTIFVFIIAMVVIFLLSLIFSKFAVAPIVQSYERQKRFITDVSHEFKTPLSIIKADNDVIEIDNGESEWTSSINNQITRLNTLVESLITLTKLDEDSSKLNKQNFSLTTAINETLEEFSSSAQNNGLKFETNIQGGIVYKGDESSIRKMVEGLIENSIKYATPETSISVKLFSGGNKITFSVENHCVGLPVGKHNEWFQRFYREDASRNSSKKGFGIGLSVAKSICDRHGGKINAESLNADTVIVTVVL